MLVIRLSRTGKKHQAYFRIAVADSRKTPTAKVVELLGNYDPHAKKLTVNKERLDFYLKNGAQPSNSVAKLLKKEKIELPKWVKITEKKRAPKKKEEPKEVAPKAEKPTEESAEEPKAETETSENNEKIAESTEITEAPEEDVKEEKSDEEKEETSKENNDK